MIIRLLTCLIIMLAQILQNFLFRYLCARCKFSDICGLLKKQKSRKSCDKDKGVEKALKCFTQV